MILPRQLLAALTAALFTAALPALAETTPPAGFTALFNGSDLTGWRGGSTFDPRKLAAMPEEQRTAQVEKWTASMREHWKAEGGELLNDGKGDYATTEKEFGNFELLVDYNMAPLGDSGIYLRNVPQVQIWDHTNERESKNGANKGSGGLWNNSPGAPGKDPLVLADKPSGEWNHFRIVMVGARVSVWLNDQLVVDHATLENYYDRKTPILPRGPICLQTHGAPIKWRNIFIREIGTDEANKILQSHGADSAFKSLFDGTSLAGWQGAVENYEVRDGAIVCKPGKGGNLLTKDEYADFVTRLEFKLPPGGNNGLAIRCPLSGDTAYQGMCELQVLDDNYEKVRGKIDPRQAHGSAYGMVAAARGYQHPIGDWNFEEVTVKGPTIKVELNGTVILDTDLSKVDMQTVMGGSPHPGKDRTSGFFGFAGHSDPVMFRNVSIKPL